VCHYDDYVVLVPFWAVWPFETLALPRAHHGALSDSHVGKCTTVS
jgi:galactose-1-phosphate uridylyltransferase